MDNQTQETTSGGSSKFVLPVVVAALIVFAAVGFYLYQNNSTSPAASITPSASNTPAAMETTENASGEYKNGTYSVTGNYLTPGGERNIDVELTLTDGVVSEVEVTPKATDATSQRFQGEFVSNYKPMVVGKSIDELNITKVSGSSLTPKGFMDALEKIKVEAQA